MNKPKVLVFIDWYTPGYKAGGPVRSLVNLVDHLRDRIDFHIVTSDTDYTERAPYPGIIPDRWTALAGDEKVWYASRGKINGSTSRGLLGEQRWDAVYINGIYSRWSSIGPLRSSKGMPMKRIVAVRGMLAAGPMKHGALKKRAFLAAARLTGLYRDVRFQATSEEEIHDIQRWIDRNADVRLVPNLPRKLAGAMPTARGKEPGELRLVSVARIAVEKNTLFAIEQLKDVHGEVVFDLFGPIYDETYWQQCRRAIAGLPPNVKVNHRGAIEPDRVPGLFGNYHALFMPSAGENFGHTMIEALGTGLPILISDRTPWRGLEEKMAGWDLRLDRPTEFRSAIERLCRMPQAEYQKWEAGAFSLAQRYLSDPVRVQQAFALFTS